jgi:hypothetical protein
MPKLVSYTGVYTLFMLIKAELDQYKDKLSKKWIETAGQLATY